MSEQELNALLLRDVARTVVSLEDIEAVRRARNPRRLYLMFGGTSHVFAYRKVEEALEDFDTLLAYMGDNALVLNDMEPTFVDKSAILGVRDFAFREELIVILPGWTLICKFGSEEDRLEAYKKAADVLLGP